MAATPVAATPVAATPRVSRPVITSVSLSSAQAPATGKPLVISISVRHATTCTFFSQHAPFSALYVVKTVSCASGHARATMPAVGNPYQAKERVRYMVQAHGKNHGLAQRRLSVLQAGLPKASRPPVAPAPPLTIASAALPTASVGVAYSAPLTASGGTAPYVWSVASGSLPTGLSLSTSGAITGTPTTVGQTTFSADVADSTPAGARSATATFSINVAPYAPPAYTSPNWSGYFETGGPFTSVTGTFNVPSLAPAATTTDTAEWVGIDGVTSTSLIQAGVNEAFDPATTVVRVDAWWEILPAPATLVPILIAPGDEVTVTISQVGAGVWTIVLTNDTTGQSFATSQPYSGPAASADWIVEAPTLVSSGSVLTLGSYAPNVTFGNLGVAGMPSAPNDVVMVQGGVAVSTPSPFTPAGFTVAYGGVAPTPP